MTQQPSYRVVINDEEQYSIWPGGLRLPAGWSETGVSGSKDECLTYIDEVWTDMRPLSLRAKLGCSPGMRTHAAPRPLAR